LKLLIDMNLSPSWVAVLARHGWEAIHWSAVGDAHAPDRTIMEYARSGQFVILTHDLDFGTLLALTHTEGPSVIEVRTQDVLPEHMGPVLIPVLREHQIALEAGALIVVDEDRLRVRILPIAR
jgi:predicted nuclease of predicted toxin-antitoxin system